MCNLFLVINLIIFVSFSTIRAENNKTFPEGFLIGVSTSAYQTEGRWNEDGKGENIWDRWIHNDPSRIKNSDNADVACDSYDHQKMNLDVILAESVNITHYRFSISWSRLLPTGMNTSVNTKAVTFYQDLIDLIQSRGMIPMATLYYYDLPQPLQDLGGWTNPDMVKYFVEYARVAFQYFSKVEIWITFNDPRAICRRGYGEGSYAPGIAKDGVGDYLCSYVVLNSHAAVYHLYKEDFPDLKGKVSISLDIEWSEPATDSSADEEAAERRNMFEFGIYGHPIFIGNWPQVVIDRVGNRSKNENIEKSRLPQFTNKEIEYIKGTADFMGINTYTTYLVSDTKEDEYGDPGYMKDMRANAFFDPGWTVTPDKKAIVPWGVRKALNWLKIVYNDPEIFITENGVSDESTQFDYNRIYFFIDYLLAILDAMYEDNVRVFGFTAKSLLDEFEWTDGYSQRYGLFSVDFSHPNRTRDVKWSVFFFMDLTSTLRVPVEVYRTTPKPTTGKPGGGTTFYPSLILVVLSIYVFYLVEIFDRF